MEKYTWADNAIKFNRAKENAKFALGRSELTEDEIKQEYIKIGGKIAMNDEIKQESVEESKEEPKVESESVEIPVEVPVIPEPKESPKVESSESVDGSEVSKEPKVEEVFSESTDDVAL